jgi:TDG/mug DNA glycosylase family protein
MSLRQQQYYANPQNQFWRIVFDVFGQPLPAAYEERVSYLGRWGISLWDVLAYCEREGSSDSAIRAEAPNNFPDFFMQNPHIKHVFFNGAKARDVWRKHVRYVAGKEISFHTMPSTSPANTQSFADKVEQWKIIREICGGIIV